MRDLGPRARDWLAAALTEYQFAAVEGRRLLESMRSLSRIEALEAAIAEAGMVTQAGEPHPLLAALVREQRVFSRSGLR